MSDKFQNKYRIPSARLQNWDYGSNAMYFVTICTQNRKCYFGEIAETRFIASPLGKIANQYWQDGRDAINRVSTTEPEPETKIGGCAGNNNPMINDNLSRIIRWYKGRVSFESHKIHAGFAWQSRFHDHIIRNDESFQRISNYIANNPSNWRGDKFFYSD